MPWRKSLSSYFGLWFAGLVGVVALMPFAGPPLLTVAEKVPHGIVSLELASNEGKAGEILRVWADAKVTDVAVTAVYWDFLLIVVYGITFTAAVVLACSAFSARFRRWLVPLALGAVLMAMLLDGVEDIGLLKMLAASPGHALGNLAFLTALCACGKFGLLFLLSLFVLACPVVALISWFRRPRPRLGNTKFEHVLHHELDAVEARRGGAAAGGAAGTLEAERKAALDKGLVGLAFSGGGIRSGTFSLGFLQGLARLRLLRLVDYLSTVSGGGYAGAWLAAWVYREGVGADEAARRSESELAALARSARETASSAMNRIDNDVATAAATVESKLPTLTALVDAANQANSTLEAAGVEAKRATAAALEMPNASAALSQTVEATRAAEFAAVASAKQALEAALRRRGNPKYAVDLSAEAIKTTLMTRAVTEASTDASRLAAEAAARSDTASAQADEAGATSAAAETRIAAAASDAVDVTLGTLNADATVSQAAIAVKDGAAGSKAIANPATGFSALANVEKQLDPSRVSESEASRVGVAAREVRDAEPEPIRHLRAYSNYLASRPGLFSGESWALGAIYLRNTFVNQLILGGAALVFVLVGHLLVWCFDQGGEASGVAVWYTGGVTVLFLLAGFFAAWMIAWSKARSFVVSHRSPTSSQSSELSLNWFHFLVALLVIAAVAGCWAFTIDPVQANELHDQTAGLHEADVPREATTLRHGWYQKMNKWLEAEKIQRATWKFVLLFAAAAALCAAGAVLVHCAVSGHADIWTPLFTSLFLVTAVGSLFYLSLKVVLWPLAMEPAAVLTLGPPLILLAFTLAGAGETAIFSRWMTTYEREWRSRLGAALGMAAAAWLAFFAAILYLPWGVAWANERLHDWVTPAAVAAWAASTLGGILAGKSPRTGDGASRPSQILEWVATLGPVVFLVGLLALLSVLARYLVADSVQLSGDGSLDIGGDGKSFLQMAIGAVVCLVGAQLLSSFTDVNVFSMHALYANRLVRCYLGASRRKDDPRGTPSGSGGTARRDNPVTGFDPADDIPLSDLRYDAGVLNYRGPYPLFNTALNLVAGGDLATRDRKAASFVLTPDFCGSDPTEYAPTPRGADDKKNLTLGRAMSISGAAVDPNMSFHQSPQVTALLTVFNARLGWWLQNPGRAGGQPWAASAPLGGMLVQLTREFLGLTDAKGQYVHLSDGGHYDNSGVYELIRRRCRFVIALDVAEDHPDASENLANLIRLVRSDFGIRIEIETAPIRKDAAGLSRWHVAVGSIRYDDVDDQAVAGTLVFLRASMTGDEPPDVRQYAIAHPDFPHTTTLNQFFDEARFESYRALGEHIARSVFEGPIEDSNFDADGLAAGGHAGAARRLFAAIRNHWFPPPPAFEENYHAAGQNCAALLAKVRTDPNLRRYADALYPEFAGLEDAVRRAELLAVNETLDIMEEVWMGIRLSDYHSHPMHRGWMDAMRRWSASTTFQWCWPVLRGEYSKDFARFCERTLSLPRLLAVPQRLARAGDEPAALDRLNAEFLLGWGDELATIQERNLGPVTHHFRNIKEAATQAGIDAGAMEPMVWLLRLAKRVPGQDGDAPRVEIIDELRGFPVGVLIVSSSDGPFPHEVLFWIRGAYRSQGLGRSAVEYAEAPESALLHERIRGELRAAGVPEVIARFPASGSGAAVRLEQELWKAFFHDYAFHRDRADRDGDFLTLRCTP